jgi:hypothetical protein
MEGRKREVERFYILGVRIATHGLDDQREGGPKGQRDPGKVINKSVSLETGGGGPGGSQKPSPGEDSFPLATHTAGEPETTPANICTVEKEGQDHEGQDCIRENQEAALSVETHFTHERCRIFGIDKDEKMAGIRTASVDEGKGSPSMTIKVLRKLLEVLGSEIL